MTDEEMATMKARAALDQMREGIKDIAQMAHAYFVALKDAGFDEETAFGLTETWHTLFWSAQFLKKTGTDG